MFVDFKFSTMKSFALKFALTGILCKIKYVSLLLLIFILFNLIYLNMFCWYEWGISKLNPRETTLDSRNRDSTVFCNYHWQYSDPFYKRDQTVELETNKNKSSLVVEVVGLNRELQISRTAFQPVDHATSTIYCMSDRRH